MLFAYKNLITPELNYNFNVSLLVTLLINYGNGWFICYIYIYHVRFINKKKENNNSLNWLYFYLIIRNGHWKAFIPLYSIRYFIIQRYNQFHCLLYCHNRINMYNMKKKTKLQFSLFIYEQKKKGKQKYENIYPKMVPLAFFWCVRIGKNKHTARKNKLYFRKYIMCYISGRDTEVDKTGKYILYNEWEKRSLYEYRARNPRYRFLQRLEKK